MHSIEPSRRQLAGMGLGSLTFAFVLLSFVSSPAAAQMAQNAPSSTPCPVLSLANPNPGDDILPGGYFISGTAYDPAATDGAGITRIDFYLGERDQGGINIGSAVPGNVPGNPRGFSVETTVPNGMNTGLNFVADAISAVTGQHTLVEFPVLVGTQPTVAVPTATLPGGPSQLGETVTNTCARAASGAVSGSAPAAAQPGASATPSAAMAVPSNSTASSSTACPIVSLANPNPGDDILPGGYFISGTAYDPAATQGTGISRIDFYLGERDQGGVNIGSAVPGNVPGNSRGFSVQTTVPNGMNTGLNFVADAISAVTGQHTLVEFPVFVGKPPTVAVPTVTLPGGPAQLGETVTSTCAAAPSRG